MLKVLPPHPATARGFSKAEEPVQISRQAALSCGYQPLSGPYKKSEQWMLDNTVKDLRRGKRDFVLVAEMPALLPDDLSVYVRPHGSLLSPE